MKKIALLSIMLPISSFAQTFTEISSFGDSPSDCGNKHAISHAINTATDGAVVTAATKPNLIGRASDGLVWTEHLAQMMSLPSSSSARAEINTSVEVEKHDQKQLYRVQAPSKAGNNWAVGGAMALTGHFDNLSRTEEVTSVSGGEVFPNTATQIANRIEAKGQFKKKTLVTYMIGTNNMWYTLYGDLGQTGKQAADFAITDINTLIKNQAKTIVVGNIPDFSEAPWFAGEKEKAEEFIASFNSNLEEQVNELSNTNPGVRIIYIDSWAFYNKVKNNVNKYGLYEDKGLNIKITNVTDASYQTETGEIIANPANYMYWDGIHPTTNMHRLFAKHVADTVNCCMVL